MKKSLLKSLVAAVAIVVGFSSALAQTKTKEDFPNVSIKNFGQMDDRFYRGGQPEREEFQALADMGITTVINLRNDPKEFEKETVESLGMRYVHIPMSDKKYPDEGVDVEFLRVVDDPDTGKFFVHCRGGKHRTGAIGAVYRFTKYNWNYDQVYSEMKDFNFYTFLWFYKPIKSYVKDYAEEMGLRDAPPAKQAIEAVANN
ncbi:MAG: hypothetical protein DWQ47_03715 [Acidobacteria bacterium]|nr:MAG: hypothetical protein DWQ32_07265 [Acidobacteriota bacterium]REK01504.1 MAG: hypothetical protein DWQ38_03700 [Acidobacteriota bacterium]REK14460.1 MAG: hypothetical protein DWQ43_12955 [Acidobacteriota bacterium]REK45175.1 MAG: hypothetical protein DWQ47_03715 [Acidobacteriota bacterium]